MAVMERKWSTSSLKIEMCKAELWTISGMNLNLGVNSYEETFAEFLRWGCYLHPRALLAKLFKGHSILDDRRSGVAGRGGWSNQERRSRSRSVLGGLNVNKRLLNKLPVESFLSFFSTQSRFEAHQCRRIRDVAQRCVSDIRNGGRKNTSRIHKSRFYVALRVSFMHSVIYEFMCGEFAKRAVMLSVLRDCDKV